MEAHVSDLGPRPWSPFLKASRPQVAAASLSVLVPSPEQTQVSGGSDLPDGLKIPCYKFRKRKQKAWNLHLLSLSLCALGPGEHVAPERLPGAPWLLLGLGAPVHLQGHSQEGVSPPGLLPPSLLDASCIPEPGLHGSRVMASRPHWPTEPPPSWAHAWPTPPGPPESGSVTHPVLLLPCLNNRGNRLTAREDRGRKSRGGHCWILLRL